MAQLTLLIAGTLAVAANGQQVRLELSPYVDHPIRLLYQDVDVEVVFCGQGTLSGDTLRMAGVRVAEQFGNSSEAVEAQCDPGEIMLHNHPGYGLEACKVSRED